MKRNTMVAVLVVAVVAGAFAYTLYAIPTPRLPTRTIGGSVTAACSPAANQENPLLTFRINVQYSGAWNATAIGHSNSTANQAFTKCYSGDGNGWILISGWNPYGGAILSLTIQKMDASNGNLTAIGNGQMKSTVVPYGVVIISLTAVP